ncbi:hypothetical protein [Halobacteriovorax sp.]|uniref:hypothetical protein n=1 Tax=Halobacteriovorax sp. TaxID=2020862 RepID=UPI003AF2D069
MKNNFELISATEKDIQVIVDINNSRTNREDKDGFILDKYSYDETLAKLQKGIGLYLINNTISNETVGFLELSDKVDKRIPDQLEWEDEEVKEKFVSLKPKYIDRICLLNKDSAKGAGSFTYRKMFQLFPDKNFYAFIVTKPIENKASVRFHLKNGFKHIATFNKDEYAGFRNYQSQIFFYQA